MLADALVLVWRSSGADLRSTESDTFPSSAESAVDNCNP
jgi:hypothetical protein